MKIATESVYNTNIVLYSIYKIHMHTQALILGEI